MVSLSHVHESTNETVSPFADCVIETGKYRVKIAESQMEIEQALRLRFNVFNLELGEGNFYAYFNGMDVDEYDQYCHHLLVIEKQSGQVVGTYRLQDAKSAERHIGYYSNTEFALELLPSEVLLNAVEAGRSCIHAAHRNSRVLYLLWKGIARYLHKTNRRYLFGCCSLHTQNDTDAWQVYQYFNNRGYIHPEIHIPSNSDFKCDKILNKKSFHEPDIPELLQLYLNIGAKVCSPPAKDRDFKTIDFLILLDVQQINSRAKALFFQ